jgi:hypothetical protein
MSNVIARGSESASNVVAQTQQRMLSRVDAAKQLFVKGPTVVRRADAELPQPLQGYEPARCWHDETIETWMTIRTAAPGTVIVSPERYLAVLEDSLRVTGPTPWCDPTAKPDMRIMFAGRWVAPDLEALRPRITYVPTPRRLGRLRLISGLEMLQLRIPRKSCRSPYQVNQDACYVDFRRLKRAKRRLQ